MEPLSILLKWKEMSFSIKKKCHEFILPQQTGKLGVFLLNLDLVAPCGPQLSHHFKSRRACWFGLVYSV
jgi:hypothetical protein